MSLNARRVAPSWRGATSTPDLRLQRGTGASTVVRVARVLLAVLAVAAAPATAQIIGDPPTATYLGSRPVKTPGGPDVSWNGTTFQVRPGGEIHWEIRVIHDDPAAPLAIVTIDDYVPDPADWAVLPFVFPGDVLAQPPTGTLEWAQPWLHHRNADVRLGETVALVIRTRVSGTAPVGSPVCNLGLVNYVAPPTPPGIGIPTYAYTITPTGEDTMTCVVVSGDPNLAGSYKSAADASGDGVVQAGERVDYAITVRNTGSSDALDVEVTDDLDPLLTPVAAGQGGSIAGRRITWNRTTTPALARVRPGASFDLTFAATAGCVDDGGSLCNQARLATTGLLPVGSDDPADAELSSPTCLPTGRAVLAGSSLSARDASGDGTFMAGEALTFDLDVTNSGSDVARDVVVVLPVPANVGSVVPRNGGSLVAGSIRWDATGEPGLLAIAPGGSVALGFDAVIDATAAHDAVGCATATLEIAGGCPLESSDDPRVAGPADATCFTVTREPLLALETSIAPSGPGVTVGPGDVLDIEAVVRWVAGAPAASVIVTLTVPDTPVLGSLMAADGGIAGVGTFTWDAAGTPALAALGPGDVVTLHASATVLCSAPDAVPACASGLAGAANMSASVASDDISLPGPADPSCADVAAPVLRAELGLTEAGGNGVFEPGETVAGLIRVTNAGTAAATDVVVVLPIPASDLDVVPGAGGRLAGGSITWDAASTPQLASMATGGSVDLPFAARIAPAAAGTRLCHQAAVSALETGGCPPRASDDAAVGGVADPTCVDVLGDGLPPGEVPDGDPASGGPGPVTLRRVGSDLLVQWSAAPRARTYHVYRGDIASFRDDPWTNPAGFVDDVEDPIPSCDLAVLRFVDEEECAPGTGSHYFLVGARNLVGDGPLGESRSPGSIVERPAVARPCP